MSLHSNLKVEMREALKSKDKIRLSVLRGLLSSLTNEAVARGKKPSEELPDEEVIAVIKREVKQRKDSVEQFTKGEREDLAQKEGLEIEILEPYLPEKASPEEIRDVAESKMTELGIHPAGGSQKGALIGATMKEMKGKADGADVKAVVDEIFGA